MIEHSSQIIIKLSFYKFFQKIKKFYFLIILQMFFKKMNTKDFKVYFIFSICDIILLIINTEVSLNDIRGKNKKI